MSLDKARILNSNGLKFLAAALMVVDHIGLLFFPHVKIFRLIGRLSMPMFALALSEGCRYTRNKTKHFLLLFGLAVICQTVYYFFDDGNLYMSILFTFSLAVLCIYAMQNFKARLFDGSSLHEQAVAATLFFSAILGTFLLCQALTIDYGFWGCMTPVLASVFDFHRIPAPEKIKNWDVLPLRVLCLGVGLVLLALDFCAKSSLPFYALISLPLLLLYNGKKGKLKSKYFFYLFYPLHLVFLEGIYLLLYVL